LSLAQRHLSLFSWVKIGLSRVRVDLKVRESLPEGQAFCSQSE
jgi:hypothetical protein